MAVTKSFPTQDAGGLSITDTRRVLAGIVARNADGTPRAGVLSAASAQIVTGRASMGYDVGVFTAATSRIAGGVELVANDALVTVATTAAPAANSRLDVIWVRSRFTQHTDGSNLPEIGVTQGTAAAVPTKPTIPAGALELATAEILSTTTTTSAVVITQSARFTAAAGGVVPLRNATDQTAFTAADGQVGYRIDLGQHVYRQAGVWNPAVRGMVGTALVEPANLVLGSSPAAVPGLALAGMPTGVPVLVEVGIVAVNGMSGGNRYIDVQAYNGATPVGVLRRFSLPLPVNATHAYTINFLIERSPTSPDWTLRLGADQGSSVIIWQASLRLTVKP